MIYDRRAGNEARHVGSHLLPSAPLQPDPPHARCSSRIVLDNETLAVLRSSIRILLFWLHPFLGNDQRGMCHSSRPDLEASTLELVLRVDFAKVFPLRRFAIARRDRLICMSSVRHRMDEVPTG